MLTDHEIARQAKVRPIRNIRVSAGAGFLVILMGNILRMPGLPRRPKAEQIELLPDGAVIGVG